MPNAHKRRLQRRAAARAAKRLNNSQQHYATLARDLLQSLWPVMGLLLFDEVNAGVGPPPPGPKPGNFFFRSNRTNYGLFFSNYVGDFKDAVNSLQQGKCGFIDNASEEAMETIASWDKPWNTEFKRGIQQEILESFEECVKELITAATNSLEKQSNENSLIFAGLGVGIAISLLLIFLCCYWRRSHASNQHNQPVSINEIVVGEQSSNLANDTNQIMGERQPLLVKKLTHEERLEAVGVETDPNKNLEIKDFICPVGKVIMDEPYTITPCGHNMEYEELIKSLEINGGNCPCCRTAVLKDNKDAYIIVKNQYLKTKIIEYVEAAEKKAKQTPKETKQNNKEENSKMEVELETLKENSNGNITQLFN